MSLLLLLAASGLFRAVNAIPPVTVSRVLVSESLLVAATQGRGVYISTDAGETWARTGFPDTRGPERDLDRVFGLGSRVVDDTLELYLLSGYNGLMLSRDTGAVWKRVDGQVEHALTNSYSLLVTDSLVYMAVFGFGPLLAYDGETWEKSGSDPTAGFGLGSVSGRLLVGDMGGIYVLDRGQETRLGIACELCAPRRFFPLGDTAALFVTEMGLNGLFRTDTKSLALLAKSDKPLHCALSLERGILVGGEVGLYLLEGGELREVGSLPGALDMALSRDGKTLFVGTSAGLYRAPVSNVVR